MAQITSRAELEAWLKDKPTDWAQVIAMRAALRVLPSALAHDGNDSNKWMNANAIAFFRAVALPLIAFDFPDRDMSETIHLAGRSLAATGAHSLAYGAIDQATMVFTSTETMHGGKFQNIISFAASTIDFEIQSLDGNSARVWSIVSEDCNALESDDDPDTAVSRLRNYNFAHQLGFDRAGEWASVSKLLYALDPTYKVWINSYDCRILGKISAFDIPGDHDRTEDKAILARLADATNEDFWDKGATYVNTTLQGWIDEARGRVRPPQQDVDLPEPRPQNPDALVWQSDAENRIGVDAQFGADALDVSEEARDRHSEARDEAQRVRALCGKSDAAFEIGGLFDRYIESLGETIEAARPGQLVQRGERLRQALASRIADGAASNYGPLPDQVRDGLKGWQSAHNAFVGLDPKLARIDSALYGPDARRNIVPPDEIRAIAKSADEAKILQPGGRDALEGAAEIGPMEPDGDDRRSRLSSETAKNFGRKVLAVLWFGIKGATVSYAIGHWVVANATWFRTWFADDPATLAVVERILDWLSKLPMA